MAPDCRTISATVRDVISRNETPEHATNSKGLKLLVT
jgi:hypothetical protein